MEKRFYLGLGILVLLLALGIGTSAIMQVIHEPVADALYQAADLALEDNLLKRIDGIYPVIFH